MIFEIKEKQDKELEEMYEKAMKELDEFFELGWKRNTPRIFIVNTRKEIDNLRHEKTADWVIGWANKINIYLLNKVSFEKESCHKYSKIFYYKLLKHEICHLFFKIISKADTRDNFLWLNEGIAGYLSEQYKDEKRPKRFQKFLNQYSDWKGNAYNESSHAIKLLFDQFGKEKLLTLIKSLGKVKTEQDFNDLFEKVYGEKPNYDFFNKLLKQNI